MLRGLNVYVRGPMDVGLVHQPVHVLDRITRSEHRIGARIQEPGELYVQELWLSQAQLNRATQHPLKGRFQAWITRVRSGTEDTVALKANWEGSAPSEQGSVKALQPIRRHLIAGEVQEGDLHHMSHRTIEGRLRSATTLHQELKLITTGTADLKPDVLVAVDVNHDYAAAPGKPASSAPPLAMGKGVTITSGSVTSTQLNGMIQGACENRGIPFQLDTSGRDTGTDAMAGVLGNVDAAATSLGFPIRNMHTVSETGHTGDVLAAAHAVFELVKQLEADGTTRADFVEGHARLDNAGTVEGV